MSRRGHGEGSVYRFRDGWAAQLTVSAPGERRRRRMLLGRTQAEVLARMREARSKLDAGLPLDAGRLTVAAYLEQWITTLPARGVRESTADSYASNLRLHVIPAIGHLELGKLRAPHVRTMLVDLAGKASGRQPRPGVDGAAAPPALLSPRTVAYQHAVLRAALADAVRDELVGRNVALLVEPPKVPRRPVQPLTRDEARLVVTALADRHAALWLTYLGLGLRRGEALALRWDDLDLEQGTVTIARQLRRHRGHLVEVPVKTDGSATTLALPATLADQLKAHRARQVSDRLAAPLWHDPGLVFTTRIGTALEPRNVNRSWAALCERAGVRAMNLHTLRHSAASFLLAQGASMKAIQGTLRHSRMATTADLYTHLLEQVRRDAADAMDGLLQDLSRS